MRTPASCASGPDQRPPAYASGRETELATGTAAFAGTTYPGGEPRSGNGTAPTTSAAASAPQRSGGSEAPARATPPTSTAAAEQVANTIAAPTRPAIRGAGPAGRLRR